MRILITGAGGMLGKDVAAAAAASQFDVIAVGHQDLDITDATAALEVISRAAPHAVINCAAWTDVDGAEAHEDAAQLVNAAGAGNVARAAAANDARMVHISSDYVFDGHKRTPYTESDLPAPLSAYGRSKLAGEHAVREAASTNHTIVRTSWLFGAGGRCFPHTILGLAAEREQLTVVDDQVGSPTFTGHLAPVLVSLVSNSPIDGTIHLAGGGECSWFELARFVVDAAGVQVELFPGRAANSDRPAPRPRYSVLRTERANAPALPPWQDGATAFLSAGVAQ